MILERQIKQSEEYAIQRYHKKREEKDPTPDALKVEPAIVYGDSVEDEKLR